jgi:hypothetical protein
MRKNTKKQDYGNGTCTEKYTFKDGSIAYHVRVKTDNYFVVYIECTDAIHADLLAKLIAKSVSVEAVANYM